MQSKAPGYVESHAGSMFDAGAWSPKTGIGSGREWVIKASYAPKIHSTVITSCSISDSGSNRKTTFPAKETLRSSVIVVVVPDP